MSQKTGMRGSIEFREGMFGKRVVRYLALSQGVSSASYLPLPVRSKETGSRPVSCLFVYYSVFGV